MELKNFDFTLLAWVLINAAVLVFIIYRIVLYVKKKKKA